MRASWTKVVAAISTGLLLVAGLVAAVPAAAQAPPDCPQVMPVADLRKGMMATGKTVSEGRTIEDFTAEILGVIPDGVGPGRDMIVVDTSSPAIDAAGGIWFGMSGSPIYIDNKLVGAVAFGLSFGASTIGGVTPAQQMFDVFGYPSATSSSSSSTPVGYRSRVRIPDGLRRTIAQRTGMAPDEIGGLRRLRVPLSISGVTDHALRHVSAAIAKERLPLIPYAGSAAPAAPQAHQPQAPLAGSSFAGALSYGDITAAGVGTTTFACGGKVLAFGHPFTFQGATTLGANAADAIAIVDDPLFGPFKLANIAESIGTVDQDRLAGIRAVVGGAPPAIPIRTNVFSVGTQRSRSGETDVVLEDAFPFLSFIHALTNIDVTVDRIGEGSAGLNWTITGTRADGSTFQLTRTNLFVSDFDISIESLFEFQGNLFALLFNGFEEIEFTGVDLSATVEDEVKLYTIEDVLVRVGGGEYQDRRRVRAQPGSRIGLRVTLSARDRSADRTVDLEVRVPRNASGEAYIEIVGGRFFGFFGGECFFEGGGCASPTGDKIESLDELIASLQDAPMGNELMARLFSGRGFKPKSEDSELLDQVVDGAASILVRLDGGGAIEAKPRG